jgi:hypothetical protein
LFHSPRKKNRKIEKGKGKRKGKGGQNGTRGHQKAILYYEIEYMG